MPKIDTLKELVNAGAIPGVYNYTPPRAPGNYDPVAACEECCVKDFGPSLTQQSQTEEADINTIVKRFGLTGQLPENLRAPTYGDFDGVLDYKTAMDAVTEARSTFMKMPAAIRARFDHDPALFVDYCSDPANIDALRELGLAVPKKTQESPATGAGRDPATDAGTGGKGVQGGPGTP